MKITTLIYKDFLLILKDKTGAALMLLMPVVLVLIMTLLQENTFKAIGAKNIDMAILNLDKDTVGNRIREELNTQSVFRIHDYDENNNATDLELEVAKGIYSVGLIIPENVSSSMRSKIKKETARAFNSGNGTLNSTSDMNIMVLFDPVIPEIYKTIIERSIHEYSGMIEKELVVQGIIDEVNKRTPGNPIGFEIESLIKTEERYAAGPEVPMIPNSVQHNVPAWTIFAMFFIVVSLAGNIIFEKREGSYARLMAAPVTRFSYLLSKLIVYVAVCVLQFAIMLVMGMHLFPMMGLQPLEIGDSYAALVLMALTVSLASIGYSILVGTVASTFQQAASFGSVSVVILSAIGGIWVPVFAMPSFMQKISVISPMNWGINGFYTCLIRNGGLGDIALDLILLTVFFASCMLLSVGFIRYKENSI